MSVKYTDNTASIRADVNRKIPIAIRLMLGAIRVKSTPVTPRKTGELRNKVIVQVLGRYGVIKWMAGHARILETKQFRNYTTPGTGPHFAEKNVRAVVKDAPRYFEQAGIR